jgi:hypothetical protein
MSRPFFGPVRVGSMTGLRTVGGVPSGSGYMHEASRAGWDISRTGKHYKACGEQETSTQKD